MAHDPQLAKNEAAIELCTKIPDWIQRLERPPMPCLVPRFEPLEDIRVVCFGVLFFTAVVHGLLLPWVVTAVSGEPKLEPSVA